MATPLKISDKSN